MQKIWILLASVLLLVACAGEADAPRAESIACTAAYRAGTDQGIQREETLTFADVDDEQSAPFDRLVFHAAYRTGEPDNERALRVWVTAAESGDVLHATLFQLPPESGPENQFVGGHGFTGLNYSYAPDSGAELQYWCAVE